MSAKDPVRRMADVFDKYRHKYEPYSLFERFMEFVIAGFDQTFSPIDRPFNAEENTICMELFREWTLGMEECLRSHEWYDILGDLYMDYLSGTMKKKWTGQFFTPMHICDLMAKICDPGEHAGESVMDCACGSGRMLLASNSVHPGNYCCAQDMDRICCLMTVCNFIIHGIRGEVVWGDSLNPSDYRGGWKTNELLGVIGVPCVRTMDAMESHSFRNGLTMLSKEREQTALPQEKEKPITKSKKHKESHINLQMSLFDDL